MNLCNAALLLISFSIAAPAFCGAQGVPRDTVQAELPSRCVNAVAPMHPVSDSARSAAQAIAGRAQAASIVGDNAAATELYQQAADLNPTDPAIAYALGREYEASHDPRAMGEYCRFLAIKPGAAEAADVRQRIAELALALPPDTTVVRIPVTAPAHVPAPAAAFFGGLVIPGLGQMVTHRPAVGVLVLVASGAGIAFGLQSKQVTSQVTHTAVDPLGHSYQFQTTETRTDHPNAAAGFGAAAAISLIAAIEAAVHAHGSRAALRSQSSTASLGPMPNHGASPLLTFTDRSIGFGLSLR